MLALRGAGPPEAKSAQERPGGTRDNRHTQPGRVRAAGHVYADDHQKFAVRGLASGLECWPRITDRTHTRSGFHPLGRFHPRLPAAG